MGIFFHHIQPLFIINENFAKITDSQEKRIYRGRVVQHKKSVLLVVSVMDSFSIPVLLGHTVVWKVSFSCDFVKSLGWNSGI